MTLSLFAEQEKLDYIQCYDWHSNAPNAIFITKFTSQCAAAERFIAKCSNISGEEKDNLYELLFCTPANIQINIIDNNCNDQNIINQRKSISNDNLMLLRDWCTIGMRERDIVDMIIN